MTTNDEQNAAPVLTGAVLTADTITLYSAAHDPLTVPRAGCILHPEGFTPGTPRPARMTLDVITPDARAAGMTYRYHVDTDGPQGSAALRVLGLHRWAVPPTVERVELTAPGLVMLTTAQGQDWPLYVPAGYVLAGRHSEAIHQLDVNHGEGDSAAFQISTALWRQLAPLL